jgi:hypothetical protein
MLVPGCYERSGPEAGPGGEEDGHLLVDGLLLNEPRAGWGLFDGLETETGLG